MKQQFSSTKGIVPLLPTVALIKTTYELSRDFLEKLASLPYQSGIGLIRRVTLESSQPFSPYATNWKSTVPSIDEKLSDQNVFLESITFNGLKPVDINALRQEKDLLPYALQLGSCEVTAAGFYKNGQSFSVTAHLCGTRIHCDGTFTARSGSRS